MGFYIELYVVCFLMLFMWSDRFSNMLSWPTIGMRVALNLTVLAIFDYGYGWTTMYAIFGLLFCITFCDVPIGNVTKVRRD